ncbi:MAG: hypothetical protein U9O54_03645, partial [Chloroflexota bacterium]|nr:hypothetical protein [Chloroflexota bacterium]
MLGVAALWPFMDITGGEAVAASHAILVVVVILATIFWRRPWYLYGVGVLAFSATTFALTAFDLTLAQASVGWISLSLLLIVVALNLGNRSREMGAKFAPPLLYSGYVIAALALVPGFFPYDEARLVYSLGNWLGLAVWGAYLTHRQQPGYGKFKSIFHWFAALPLPFWVWVLLEYYHQPDYISALVFAALAWGMVFIAHRLARLKTSYRFPWRQTGLVVSVLAPIIALLISDYTRPLTLLSAGLLYFVDAFMSRKSRELFPAGLVFAMGLADLLDKADISTDPRLLALALLAGLYLLAGLWGERRKVTTGKFLAPLYFISHAIIAYVLMRVLTRSLFVYPVYTDTMRLWDAASLILPGVVYMLYAWGRNRERWAHAGVWLGALGGVFLVSALSHGTGFSAAVASAASVALILVERGLYHLRRHPRLSRSQQVLASFTSRLYHNPLLFGGWTISLGTIALALGRNLVILEGGRVQQIWAVVALTIITALYAGSAYLFRKTRFVWLAALLVFAPWTILTDMGWFTFYRLTSPGFSASWMVLAWTLYGVSRWVQHISHRRYALPVKVVTHLLTVFALTWAFTDAEASRYAFGMAMSLYVLMSWVKHGEIRRDNGEEVSSLEANKYLYPAVGLFLVWSLYLLELLPGAEVEHYGLLLLLLSPLVLAMGRWLRRAAPRPEIRRDYPFPAYLGAYLALLAGTILVSEQVALLSMALLYNALIMLFSVWIFRHPAWVIPAVGLAPLSLLLALDVAHISEDRWGWWLMGLSVTYLAAAWLLRRVKQRKYSTAPILAALTLTALGLIPSSADQIAALWGYAAATLIYAFTAFWLKRPVLLTPASAFVVVPYVIALDRSALAFDYYGLALLPGAILALLGGWLLERAYGDWNNFPWMEFRRWPRALWERWLGWWGLPLYALGLGLATSSPFFTGGRSDLAALTLFLLAGFYGWAIYRFRSRFWLLAVALSVHLGAVLTIDALGWWQHNPDVGRLLFTPVTVST